MAEPERDAATEGEPFGPGEYYLLICLVALVLMVLALNELHLGERLYAPYVVFGLGVICLVFRLPSGPPLLLMSMIILMLSQATRALALSTDRGGSAVLAYQLVLCAAALAFTIAFYRRLGIEGSIFPVDTRKNPSLKPGEKPVPVERIVRPAPLATTGELFMLACALPFYCGAGYLLWVALSWAHPWGRARDVTSFGEWRLLTICWSLAIVGIGCSVVWTYLNRLLATPTQNLLYLQDQLWVETLAEQGLANRLLVRSRLRLWRRKEKR
jgi:hypothetical protein